MPHKYIVFCSLVNREKMTHFYISSKLARNISWTHPVHLLRNRSQIFHVYCSFIRDVLISGL